MYFGAGMPEGPEVRVIGDIIAEATDKPIVGVNYTRNKKYKWERDGIVGWEKLQQSSGRWWAIENVIVKGKLIRIDIFDGKVKLSILNTLGLEGTWAWNLNIKHPRSRYKRFWFHYYGGDCLAYYDSRNFGTIKIVDRKEADEKLQKIGWDLLQAPMEKQAWRVLQNTKSMNNKVIGGVLMNQSLFSGIGNIYKAEILYELNIHPNTIVGDLNVNVWDQINQIAHQIMQASYHVKGSSVKSYTGGSFQQFLKIYKQKLCPQKHPVKSIKQDGRTTWYCQTCQPILTCITPSVS